MTAANTDLLGPYLSHEFLLSQVANVFWSVWFNSVVEDIEWPRGMFDLPLVVAYKAGESSRFDLLIFQERNDEDVQEISPWIFDQPDVFAKFLGRLVSEWSRPEQHGLETSSLGDAYLRFALTALGKLRPNFEQVAVDYAKQQRPCVIFLPKPQLQPQASIPDPALEAAYSTAGVVATNAAGKLGVTVSIHALDRAGIGRRGKVPVGRHGFRDIVSYDRISDSAFLELNPAVELPTRPFKSRLQKVMPGHNETLEFSGITTTSGKAVVKLAPMTLALDLPGFQRHLLTDLVTLPGDSGCACFDPRGDLVGFLFGVSGTNYADPSSIWIWADSVFQAHKLR